MQWHLALNIIKEFRVRNLQRHHVYHNTASKNVAAVHCPVPPYFDFLRPKNPTPLFTSLTKQCLSQDRADYQALKTIKRERTYGSVAS
jgi:hypothetical protein